ncbi:MAG: hypothetical protein K0S44_2546 [Bacteroidetes bacterium]|jgi:hypothetical protein|nr:hypothetical protein [Bacteroidota bacterium]
MEASKVEELRRFWGDQPCVHPALKKVMETKDKVCIVCGRVVYAGIQSRPNKARGFRFKNNLFD